MYDCIHNNHRGATATHAAPQLTKAVKRTREQDSRSAALRLHFTTTATPIIAKTQRTEELQETRKE